MRKLRDPYISICIRNQPPLTKYGEYATDRRNFQRIYALASLRKLVDSVYPLPEGLLRGNIRPIFKDGQRFLDTELVFIG